MESLFAEAGEIFAAILENDAWALNEALDTNGAWLMGFFATLLGTAVVLVVYRLVPVLDRHLERTVMVWTYLAISAIIFVEVFRRFVLSEQVPWSTTLPSFLFLIMTWFGCSYNVKLRTHLSFSEFRSNMPRLGQLICLCLDTGLWFGFCWIVIVTSTRVAVNSASNFQILPGTDNVLQWWFLITVPIGFMLLAARAIENLLEDLRNFRSGSPLIEQAVIGGE